MATLDHTRAVAIVLQGCVEDLYDSILPLYGAVVGWVTNSIDADLPADTDVDAIYEAYKLLTIPGVSLGPALRDVDAADGEFSGQFGIPSGYFPISFAFDGPLEAAANDVAAYGVQIDLNRATLLCRDTGDAGGTDLTVTVTAEEEGETSITIAVLTLTGGSGIDQLLTIPQASLAATQIAAGKTIKVTLSTVPDNASDVRLILWARGAE